MKIDLILKFKQNWFSKVIWSSTFNTSIFDIVIFNSAIYDFSETPQADTQFGTTFKQIRAFRG